MSSGDDAVRRAQQEQEAAAAYQYQRDLNDPQVTAAEALAKKNRKKKKKKTAQQTSTQIASIKAQAQASSTGGAAAGVNPDTGNPFASPAGFNVYTGSNGEPSFPLPPGDHRVLGTPEATTEDASQALRDAFLGKSKQDISNLQDQLKKAGYPGVEASGALDQGTIAAYTQLLQDVRVSNEAGSHLTPDQYLAQKISGGNKPDKSSTHTTSSVSLSTGQDARATALSQFEQSLGRRPSQSEIDAFYQALTAYESANPTVQTDTTSGNGLSTTSSSSGGANPAEFAQQYVDQNFGTEEGSHDALHYYNLALSSLAGPPAGLTHAM